MQGFLSENSLKIDLVIITLYYEKMYDTVEKPCNMKISR